MISCFKSIKTISLELKERKLPEIINPEWKGKLDRGYTNGNRMYSRLLIKRV